MGNFIGMVYSQLKEAGVDTKDMDTGEAIDKWNAMQEKEGKFGSDKPTDAESKRMKEMGIEDEKKSKYQSAFDSMFGGTTPEDFDKMSTEHVEKIKKDQEELEKVRKEKEPNAEEARMRELGITTEEDDKKARDKEIEEKSKGFVNGRLQDLNAKDLVERSFKEGSLFSQRVDNSGENEYSIHVDPNYDGTLYVDIYDKDDNRISQKKYNTKEEAIKAIQEFQNQYKGGEEFAEYTMPEKYQKMYDEMNNKEPQVNDTYENKGYEKHINEESDKGYFDKENINKPETQPLRDRLSRALKDYADNDLIIETAEGKDGYTKVEIRAEMDYEDMDNMIDNAKLNEMISKIDNDAYFEAEDAGIINAYVDTKKLNKYLKKNDNLDNDEYKNYKSEKEQTLKNEGYDVENMSDKEKNLAYSKLEKPSTQNAEQERMQDLGIKSFFNVDDIENLVKERVGTTTNWKETGYINVDGSQIDLSGKREGARPGSRSVDHRDVFEPEEYDSDNNTGSDALINYVNRGNIRVIPEYPGIEINENKEPTPQQYQAIANMVSRIGGNGLGIDFANNKGDVGDNALQYDGYVSPQRVVEDIKYFFKTGKIEKY